MRREPRGSALGEGRTGPRGSFGKTSQAQRDKAHAGQGSAGLAQPRRLGEHAFRHAARLARRPRRDSPEPVLIAGEDPLEVLGRRVNRLRVARNLSQEDLAGQAELDRTYISGIERGARNPTLLVLLRLARVLDVSLDALVEPG